MLQQPSGVGGKPNSSPPASNVENDPERTFELIANCPAGREDGLRDILYLVANYAAASAVVGSITERTRATLFAGKPPFCACARTVGLVRCDIDTVDLVIRDEALEPLNLWAHAVQHATGLLRDRLQLVLRQLAGTRRVHARLRILAWSSPLLMRAQDARSQRHCEDSRLACREAKVPTLEVFQAANRDNGPASTRSRATA